jgi:hypothetical protein
MMATNPSTEDGNWHLDKRVPIALILTVLVQTGGILWWAASLSERVNVLERHQANTMPQGDRLTKVEVRLEGVQTGIDEIKRLIRREIP